MGGSKTDALLFSCLITVAACVNVLHTQSQDAWRVTTIQIPDYFGREHKAQIFYPAAIEPKQKLGRVEVTYSWLNWDQTAEYMAAEEAVVIKEQISDVLAVKKKKVRKGVEADKWFISVEMLGTGMGTPGGGGTLRTSDLHSGLWVARMLKGRFHQFLKEEGRRVVITTQCREGTIEEILECLSTRLPPVGHVIHITIVSVESQKVPVTIEEVVEVVDARAKRQDWAQFTEYFMKGLVSAYEGDVEMSETFFRAARDKSLEITAKQAAGAYSTPQTVQRRYIRLTVSIVAFVEYYKKEDGEWTMEYRNEVEGKVNYFGTEEEISEISLTDATNGAINNLWKRVAAEFINPLKYRMESEGDFPDFFANRISEQRVNGDEFLRNFCADSTCPIYILEEYDPDQHRYLMEYLWYKMLATAHYTGSLHKVREMFRIAGVNLVSFMPRHVLQNARVYIVRGVVKKVRMYESPDTLFLYFYPRRKVLQGKAPEHCREVVHYLKKQGLASGGAFAKGYVEDSLVQKGRRKEVGICAWSKEGQLQTMMMGSADVPGSVPHISHGIVIRGEVSSVFIGLDGNVSLVPSSTFFGRENSWTVKKSARMKGSDAVQKPVVRRYFTTLVDAVGRQYFTYPRVGLLVTPLGSGLAWHWRPGWKKGKKARYALQHEVSFSIIGPSVAVDIPIYYYEEIRTFPISSSTWEKIRITQVCYYPYFSIGQIHSFSFDMSKLNKLGIQVEAGFALRFEVTECDGVHYVYYNGNYDENESYYYDYSTTYLNFGMRIAVRSKFLAFQMDLLPLTTLPRYDERIPFPLRFSFFIPIAWYPYNARYYWNYYQSAGY